MDPTPAVAKDWLHQEYRKRRERNPAYSLRAFSRHLGLGSGRLSEILNDKRALTPDIASKIAERLGYSPELAHRFLSTVQSERDLKTNGSVKLLPNGQPSQILYRQLSSDAFYVISDWYHYAILNLMEVPGFKVDSRWIARRLGISAAEARGALDRLLRLNLIEKRGARLVKTSGNLTTSHDISSAALKNAHRKVLELSIEALDEVSVDKRDVTAISMAVDPSKLPVAKAMIRDFRRKLCAFLEDGSKREVFSLAIQLIPLSKSAKGRK